MKKLAILLLVVMLASIPETFAISLADGYRPSGVIGPNAHIHLATRPAKICTVTITPYAADGYVNLLSTNGARTDDTFSKVNSHLMLRAGGHTANDTVQLVFPEGLNCEGNLFVDCMNAEVSIGYKQ